MALLSVLGLIKQRGLRGQEEAGGWAEVHKEITGPSLAPGTGPLGLGSLPFRGPADLQPLGETRSQTCSNRTPKRVLKRNKECGLGFKGPLFLAKAALVLQFSPHFQDVQ